MLEAPEALSPGSSSSLPVSVNDERGFLSYMGGGRGRDDMTQSNAKINSTLAASTEVSISQNLLCIDFV